MPKESRMMLGPGQTLFDICLELHMSNTGSSDPLSRQGKQHYINILSSAVNNWEESCFNKWKQFDDCVLALVKATLLETILEDIND